MPPENPDVRITGPEEHVIEVERTLGTDLIMQLAVAARRNDVMISLTVSPFTEVEGENDRDPNDR